MNNLENSMQYFFRIAEDPNYIPNSYLSMFCLLAWAVVFLIGYKANLDKINKKYIRGLGFILFSLQIFVTIWFLFSRKNPFEDSLPLYFCRMSSLILGVALIRNKINGKFTNFFALFSVFGASIALLIPDMERYNFPHFTGISFIIIHSILLLTSMYIVKNSELTLSNKDMFKLAALIIVPIHIINLIFGSNYSYTMILPSILVALPEELSVAVVFFVSIFVVMSIQKLKLIKWDKIEEDKLILSVDGVSFNEDSFEELEMNTARFNIEN